MNHTQWIFMVCLCMFFSYMSLQFPEWHTFFSSNRQPKQLSVLEKYFVCVVYFVYIPVSILHVAQMSDNIVKPILCWFRARQVSIVKRQESPSLRLPLRGKFPMTRMVGVLTTSDEWISLCFDPSFPLSLASIIYQQSFFRILAIFTVAAELWKSM